MRIDGSRLNPFWAQELQAKSQEQTALPGVPSNVGQESASGFAINVSNAIPAPPPGLEGMIAPKDLASITRLAAEINGPKDKNDLFATNMYRCLAGRTDAEGNEKDVSDLINSLSEAVAYLRDKHGEKTATLAMALIMGSGGNASSEESLSKGLVKVLKLVDRNFGIAAGDEAMAHFNGAPNQEMNDYFENGLNEKFLVKNQETPGLGLAMADMKNRFARQAAATSDTSETDQTLNNDLLKDLSTELEDATSPEELEKAQTTKALEAYGMVSFPEPELLSMTA